MAEAETWAKRKERFAEEVRLAMECGLSDWWISGDPVLPSGAKLRYEALTDDQDIGARFDGIDPQLRRRIIQIAAWGDACDPSLLDLVAVAERSESPIESRMGIELADGVAIIDHCRYAGLSWFLGQQATVEIQGAILARLDFVILGCRWDDGGVMPYMAHCPHVALAVECDGHDFHEKTKEQARRDKSRDRILISHGIHTIRFTGSEIFRRSEDLWDSDVSPVLCSIVGQEQHPISDVACR